MQLVSISKETYGKLEKAAKPLGDTADSVLERALDFYLKEEEMARKMAQELFDLLNELEDEKNSVEEEDGIDHYKYGVESVIDEVRKFLMDREYFDKAQLHASSDLPKW